MHDEPPPIPPTPHDRPRPTPEMFTAAFTDEVRRRLHADLTEENDISVWIIASIAIGLVPALVFGAIGGVIVAVTPLAWPAAVIAAVVGFAIGAIVVGWMARKIVKGERAGPAFAENARVVLGFPLMATNISSRPGFGAATALVLVYFDDPTLDLGLAADVLSGADGFENYGSTIPNIAPANANLVQRLMADQQYIPHQRVPIPLPDGTHLTAMHQAVIELLLPDGYLSEEHPYIPTIAEPGERGRCLPLPWWYLTGETPTPEAAKAWKSLYPRMLSDSVPSPPTWLKRFVGKSPHEPV